MQIKTDTATGEHNGTRFSLVEGVLIIDGTRYGTEKIKAIVEIANLLKLEGFTIKERLPQTRRGSGSYSTFLGMDWGSDCGPEEQ